MKQQLKKMCQQHRQVSSSWKSKKYLEQKQDGRKRRKRVSEKRVQLDKKSYCAKLQVKQSHGEIGHYLQSKPAKDSSLRFVALCGEFNDPLDEEGGQVLQARIKPDSAICTSFIENRQWCRRAGTKYHELRTKSMCELMRKRSTNCRPAGTGVKIAMSADEKTSSGKLEAANVVLTAREDSERNSQQFEK